MAVLNSITLTCDSSTGCIAQCRTRKHTIKLARKYAAAERGWYYNKTDERDLCARHRKERY